MRTFALGSPRTATGTDTSRSRASLLVYGWSGEEIRGESVGGRSDDLGTGVATSRLNALENPPARAVSPAPMPPLARRKTPPASSTTARTRAVRITIGVRRRRDEMPGCARMRRRSGAEALIGWSLGRPVDAGRGRTCLERLDISPYPRMPDGMPGVRWGSVRWPEPPLEWGSLCNQEVPSRVAGPAPSGAHR